ncbi:sensor histidine kinase [Leucobacter sp. W1153]|uniref:sensor histidine kinase n=1 Tax=Leucobacter sp. W1153 TaxID=3439064 RepID=UPI003F395314
MSSAASAERRRALLDTALIGAYLLGATFFITLSLAQPHVTPVPGMVAVTLACAATLVVRRRRPRLATVSAMLLVPVGALIGTGWEASILLVFVVMAALTQTARHAWQVFAAALAVSLITAALLAWRQSLGYALLGRTPAPVDSIPSASLSFAFLLGIPLVFSLLISLNIAHRRRYIASLVAQAEQARREQAQRASLARAEERENISREMHDVIAHSLAVMIALADGAESVSLTDPAEARRAVNRIAETGRRTFGEVRRLLGSVSEDIDHAHARPGMGQIPALVDEFRAAGLPISLSLNASAGIDGALSLTIYRIIQESLTNTLRHARQVRDVTVDIAEGPEVIRIEVTDFSEGAGTTSQPGRGLVGIRERAVLYAGSVEAGPHAAGGWRVAVVLPTEEV